jgi:Gram-negative bacterial TonB protein C-terminal
MKNGHSHKVMKLIVPLLAISSLAGLAPAKRTQSFTPPDVLAVTDIPYTPTTIAAGVVTLAVNVAGNGNVMNIQTLRDIPTLTTQATLALQNWKYAPASLNGEHVPSTLVVHIVFDPAFLQINNIPLGPPESFQSPKSKAAAYSPAQLLTATFAPYPSGGRGAGAVVLDLGISGTGTIGPVVVRRDVPTLTATAEAAVKNWTFSAAIYGNTTIPSKVVVAMVFRNPRTTLP